jgi:hypothetical protein
MLPDYVYAFLDEAVGYMRASGDLRNAEEAVAAKRKALEELWDAGLCIDELDQEFAIMRRPVPFRERWAALWALAGKYLAEGRAKLIGGAS